MKKVVSTEQVAHLWANQLQTEATNSGRNLYFGIHHYESPEKPLTIYSYGSHFAIAKHVGPRTILFTTRGYSNTTAKQKYVVEAASRHLNKIYCHNPEGTHEENFNQYETQAENIAHKLTKAKKPEIYLTQLLDLFETVQKYATFFNLNIPSGLLDILNIATTPQTQELMKRREGEREEAETRKKEQQAKKLIQDLIKWRNFEKESLHNNSGRDYLRYNKETNRIETSQGIEIPVKIAKTFYNLLIVKLMAGGCINCEGCNTKILDYELKEVNKEFIQVGCHFITWDEINTTAKSLKWIK